MNKIRLDSYLVEQGFITNRSQAESHIKLGKVTVNGLPILKSGYFLAKNDVVKLTSPIKYVSRAALKLESVTKTLGLKFRDKIVLDVGSSTGGFSDYALQQAAAKIIAVDVGSEQMDKVLRLNSKIELHEKTDIRSINNLSTKVDICLIDVSFISIREVLSHLPKLITGDCLVVGMVKPQFEAYNSAFKHKGVIKNEAIRRSIFRDFEMWVKSKYKIINKADSLVPGPKGNVERFYLLKLINTREDAS